MFCRRVRWQLCRPDQSTSLLFGSGLMTISGGGSGRDGPERCVWLWSAHNTFTLRTLAGQLARPAHGFRFFAGARFGRLLEMIATLHLTEKAFTLHLLLQRTKGLFDIVVANENLDDVTLSIILSAGARRAAPLS